MMRWNSFYRKNWLLNDKNGVCDISFNERDHARGFTANWLNEQEQLKIAFVENTANSSNPNLWKSLFHNFVKSTALYRIYDARLWYKGNM